MKWFLVASLCLICSATWVRGDAAADLYNKGITALNNNQYLDAAAAFDQIITGYPTTPNIDEVRIRAGYAYLYASKYTEAIDRLSKEAAPTAKPEFRGTALYFTGLAEFSAGQKGDKSAFTKTITTMTTLIDFVAKNPTPDNKNYVETAYYYRALANYELEQYDAAETDLRTLTESPQFSASLSKPDYLLRLGTLYAVKTNQLVASKKATPDEINAMANKALAAFDQVSRDPNALVQANDANMAKAEVLFLTAQLDTTGAGYQKALDAFREVRRKDDMLKLQQDRLDQLRVQQQQRVSQGAQSGGLANLGNDLAAIIGREQGRLNDLKTAPDPIIGALIRMAECYINIVGPDGKKESDESRVILHRLLAHATLTPEQQKEVDFQVLYSYVLGGQTDKADKALTDYLSKHAGDPNADSLSYQIAAKLLDRKDFDGALAQADRSLKDFPAGKYAADVITLKAQALLKLGRVDESNHVVDDFLKANPDSPQANSLLLTRGQSEFGSGQFAAAQADYAKVKDNTKAAPELQSAAYAGYIQALQSQQKFDDVIKESKVYQTKFPNAKGLPSVLLFAAMAMDQKKDPAAVAALQDIARKYPKEDAAPFALSYVVNVYQRQNNSPLMVQAYNDLQKAYPEAYPMLIQAAESVSAALLKAKKFDDVVALYQTLAKAPKPEIAAMANNKVGTTYLAAAKTMHYQSMTPETRPDAEKQVTNAEQAFLGTLKTAPDQLAAVGDAFEGLVNCAKQRRSWGLLKDPDLDGYLTKVGADLTTPEMQARLEMTKAGLVFITKEGAKDYPAALERFRKVIAANPGIHLTRQDADHYGELLIAAKDYATATKVYSDLLDNAAANDVAAKGSAYYGLGAVALAQGNLAEAKANFLKLKAMPGGGAWHPHIIDANVGIAQADETSTAPADLAEAKQIYAATMTSPAGGPVVQGKAMLGYGRLLDKSGNGIKPTTAGPSENAVHYFQQPHTIFGPATPEVSAEGLYDAGQVYDKAGDKTNAKAQYDLLLKNYSTSAPDWAAKAQAAEGQ